MVLPVFRCHPLHSTSLFYSSTGFASPSTLRYRGQEWYQGKARRSRHRSLHNRAEMSHMPHKLSKEGVRKPYDPTCCAHT